MHVPRPFGLVSLALVCVTTLGCQARPDTALDTGAVSVSLESVDQSVDALCSPAAAEQLGGQGPRGYVRSVLASLKATRALTEDFRREHGIQEQPGETAVLNEKIGELEQAGVADAPQLAQLLTARGYLANTLMLAAADNMSGTIKLDDPTQAQAAVQLGAETFGRWLEDQSVVFDPRLHLDGERIAFSNQQNALNPLEYGSSDVGSVPISMAGMRPTDVEAAVAHLPALTQTQVCGGSADSDAD